MNYCFNFQGKFDNGVRTSGKFTTPNKKLEIELKDKVF